MDAANLHPGPALVFSRNSTVASSRAALPIEAEHLSRASSCLDSPFVDPPGSEGSEPEGEGRSERLSLARGQLVASGTEPDLTLQSVVCGHAAAQAVAEEGNQHHADDASVGAIREDGIARARQTTAVMRV